MKDEGGTMKEKTMKPIRIVFVGLAVLLISSSAVMAQSRRLSDLSSRLASDAASFADTAYNDYRGNYRGRRNDIQGVMAAQQFAAGAQLLKRMVDDRSRTQDLNDAVAVLQDLARSTDRYNLAGGNWTSVRRELDDIARELGGNYGSGGGGGYGEDYPIPGRQGGRITWRGKVDNDAQVVFRGNRAEVNLLSGNPFDNGYASFTQPLPSRRVNVTLTLKRGRGEVFLEAQPTRDNEYAVVVHIRDPKGGAGDYEFEINW
jgi:hypothetical protein